MGSVRASMRTNEHFLKEMFVFVRANMPANKEGYSGEHFKRTGEHWRTKCNIVFVRQAFSRRTF